MRTHIRTLTGLAMLVLLTVAGCEAALGLGDLTPEDGGGAVPPPGEGGFVRDAALRDASDSGRADATRNDATMADATDALPGDSADAQDGTSHDATSSQDAPAADGAKQGCAIAYVAPGGSDNNPGCSPDKPKATIAAGLGAATAVDGGVPEVLVCSGTYLEQNLTIGRAVSVHGSYDCSTSPWTHPTFSATFTPSTKVSANMNSLTEPTLNIGPEFATLPDAGVDAGQKGGGGTSDAAVASAPFMVDGLFLNGPTGGTTSTVVNIRNGASVDLNNNYLLVGSIAAEALANGVLYALQSNHSAPIISSNKLSYSSALSCPSIAVLVTSDGTAASAAKLIGNSIETSDGTYNTGGGVAPAGSIGVAIVTASSVTSAPESDATITLAGNVVTAGIGTGQPATSPGAIGVYIGLHSRVTLLNNVINGGTSKTSGDAGSQPATAGVYALGANIGLYGNRIFGGQVLSGSAGPIGVYAASDLNAGVLNGGSTIVMIDNVIHGGAMSGVASVVNMHGVDIFQSDAAIVEDNTLFAGQVTTNASSTGAAYTIKLQQVYGAIVRGNILAGIQPNGTVNSEIVQLENGSFGCGSVGLFDGNLFVNAAQTDAGAGLVFGCHGAIVGLKTLESTFIEAGTAASKNLRLAHSCAAAEVEAGICAPACPDAGCMQYLLNGWNDTTFDDVLTDGGWALRSEAGCAIAAVGAGVNLASTDAGPRVTSDLLDAARPVDGSSPGAIQYRGACP